jgi:4-amino-4-deoxy-L-arabinose transferase-like glycosyltransferase
LTLRYSNQIIRGRTRNLLPIFLVIIPLVLSAFVHLWNPVGFPYLHGDEGHYIRRAMHVLEGLGPQETKSEYDTPYDHPYFGQLFLAGIFSTMGYPNLVPISDGSVEELKDSVDQLYIFPRILTGLLAVADTFLIYKITQLRYSKRAAFMATVLFAVMPLTWVTRRVILESIFLPLILSSIFFALCLRAEHGKDNDKTKNKSFDKDIQSGRLLVLISGILLGLAIFTKITSILIAPLLIYLIFMYSGKSFKNLTLWLLPVILIPMIWPAYALMSGELQEWIDGVLWQSDRDGRGLLRQFMATFKIDPMLWVVGLSGVVLVTVLKRDLFFVLWTVPFLLFYLSIPFMQHFHWIFLLPMLCMAAGICISDILGKIITWKNVSFSKTLFYSTFSAIFIFGFISTVLLINTNLNGSLFEAQALVIRSLPSSTQKDQISNNENVILMGSNWMQLFSWIPNYIFDKNHSFKMFIERNLPIEHINTKKILLLIDGKDLERFILAGEKKGSFENQRLFNNTRKIAEIEEQSDYYKKYRDTYPYTSIHENRGIEGGKIIMKTNY